MVHINIEIPYRFSISIRLMDRKPGIDIMLKIIEIKFNQRLSALLNICLFSMLQLVLLLLSNNISLVDPGIK
jgi:hypothetical protein